MRKPLCFLLLVLLTGFQRLAAEDGYRLWLRYDRIAEPARLAQYKNLATNIICEGGSDVMRSAKAELVTGLSGLLGTKMVSVTGIQRGSVVIGTPSSSPLIASMRLNELARCGSEGFSILTRMHQGKRITVIAGQEETGVLYGVFAFLRLLQTRQSIDSLSIISTPRIQLRLLDHWDNLNRTVERGYAGFSIWKWHLLPGYIDQRYIDYARANASIGINGAVVNNVNANAQILTADYLVKVAALANVFRKYGIRIYLSARFSAPIEIGQLKTADPFDTAVQRFWKNKVDEIYRYIPDFGGFLVKANSEGQPGPQNYQRTHADGANLLADALAPHKGVVMWRAFVYSNETPTDRTKQSYDEFKPFDGQFRSNVIVQVKNGPLDFQPREPFHPLFGAMPRTPLMMEFQLTQEYLGQGTHLVYEGGLMKETLDADTYAKGKGTTVARIVDGTAERHTLTGIAGVSNIGDDRNWCGHPFAQSNWFAFGRLAWDHSLSEATIAEEWIRMTFGNEPALVNTTKQLMLGSRETLVNYMTPLGLHHIMGDNHHYGPSPWSDKGRADWTPVYYHKADANGLGFERSSRGTNALEQYAPEVRKRYETLEDCPEEYLLWFHHVAWNHRLRSGKTLWETLCARYNQGVNEVRAMRRAWDSVAAKIDEERSAHVKMLLGIQEREAVWWRDACLAYFGSFSKMPVPGNYEQPAHTLDYYKNIRIQFAPGIGGSN